MESDYIARATAANHQLRAFAITSRNITEEARRIHNTSPVATAALGRLLSAGSMMGSMMKGERDVLTLQVECGGPRGGMVVTSGSDGCVKGYVNHPDIVLPPNQKGKLDVSGALGPGFLNVIRDTGLKEPYNGQVHLVSGEIAEDLTYYYATSEQIPSSVGLGVLLNRDNHVRQAGGFIIQVLPFAQEEVIATVERSLQQIHSVTDLLEQGMMPQDMVRALMGDMEVEILDSIPAQYACNCSKERVTRAVASLGRKDLEDLIAQGETIEVNCEFCDSQYYFTVDELKGFIS